MTVTRPASGYQRDAHLTYDSFAKHTNTDNESAYFAVRSGSSPFVDAVPDSIVFICDLCDPPGVIARILMQKMSRQLVEGCHSCLALA